MYFSRIRLKSGLRPRDLERLARGNAYDDHQYLWKLFAKDVEKRDFIYRREDQNGFPCFFVVSQRPPEDREGVWEIDGPKKYEPRLVVGQKLAFSLRVNPVKAKKTTEDAKRSKRHDVVMEAKKTTPKDQWDSIPALIEKTGLTWLSTRAEKHGFSPVDKAVRVDGYRQHRLFKGGHGVIRFSTLDFNGLLTVTDTSQFMQALFNGIGPAKGFGCGLMLIRKI
jgi:CRISPR system Cascade subunit CasE